MKNINEFSNLNATRAEIISVLAVENLEKNYQHEVSEVILNNSSLEELETEFHKSAHLIMKEHSNKWGWLKLKFKDLTNNSFQESIKSSESFNYNLDFGQTEIIKCLIDKKVIKSFADFKTILCSEKTSGVLERGNIQMIKYITDNKEWILSVEAFINICAIKNGFQYALKYGDLDMLKYLTDEVKWITNLNDFITIYKSKIIRSILDNQDGKKIKYLINKKIINSLSEFIAICNSKNEQIVLINGKNEILNSLLEGEIIHSLKSFKIACNLEIIRDVLRFGNHKIIEYLVNKKKWINSIKDLKNACNLKHIFSILEYGNLDILKYLVDEKKWIKSSEDFLNNCSSENMNHIMKLKDVKIIRFLIDKKKCLESIQELKNIPDGHNFVRIVSKNIEKYRNVHPLLILFCAHEDFKGDIKKIDKQIKIALKDHPEINNLNHSQQFIEIINYFKINSWCNNANIPKQERRQNIEKINKSQSKLLKLSYLEKLKKRNLILYVRQTHGEMDSFRFCMMAKTLYEYVKNEKSSIFNNFLIVPYKGGVYPKSIHSLGIPKEVVSNATGKEFQDLGIDGNLIFFTHSDTTEFSEQGSLPLVSSSVLQNPDKINDKHTHLPLFFDIQDNHTQKRKWIQKIKFRKDIKNSSDLKKMMDILFKSIQQWEFDIIEDAEKMSLLKSNT